MGCGVAFLDFDNDGWLDVLVLSGSRFGDPPANASNRLYRNNGNSNAWLKVRCIGTVSNRDAIGAKVRIKATFRGAEQVVELKTNRAFPGVVRSGA